MPEWFFHGFFQDLVAFLKMKRHTSDASSMRVPLEIASVPPILRSPLEVKVVKLPLFCQGFCTIPGGWEWEF